MRRRGRLLPAAAAVLAWSSCLQAQSPGAGSSRLSEQVRSYVAAHQQPIVRELADLVSIPNVAADRQDIRRNAEHLL